MEAVGGLLGSSAACFPSAPLPDILGFAGGAMLYITSNEIVPETHRKGHESAATGSQMVGVALVGVRNAAGIALRKVPGRLDRPTVESTDDGFYPEFAYQIIGLSGVGSLSEDLSLVL